MNEFEVKQTNGSIACNFKEMKEELSTMMTAYTSLEITEDKIPETKKDLATLRKIRKAVDDKKKDVKKSFMQPYEDFEKGVKELLAVIDEPIGMIDGKLKEFEVKRIAEKQSHLHDLYNECIGEYGDYLTFEAVKKPQWDNSSYSDKDIRYDVSEAVTKVRSEIDAIKALNSEIEEECLKVYKKNGNSLTAAIQKNSDYISAKEMARKKFEEEKRLEAEKKAEEFMNPSVAPTVCQPAESVDVWKEPTFTFRVTGEDYIKKIKEILEFSEIPYIEV